MSNDRHYSEHSSLYKREFSGTLWEIPKTILGADRTNQTLSLTQLEDSKALKPMYIFGTLTCLLISSADPAPCASPQTNTSRLDFPVSKLFDEA